MSSKRCNTIRIVTTKASLSDHHNNHSETNIAVENEQMGG